MPIRSISQKSAPVSPKPRLKPAPSIPVSKEPPSQRPYDVFKNVLDRVLALALVIVFSPLFLLIALWVMVDSPGFPFYKQWRRGRDQQPFQIYKFRTMVQNAHRKRSSLFHRNEVDGILFKLKDDPRVTSVGQFLRKYSIDEFPQLLNVVRGEMSLVGPRPFSKEVFMRPYDHPLYSTWLVERHRVLPGMTGLWQVTGRNNLPFNKLMKMDLKYVRTRTLVMDLSILARTLNVVINRKGAY